MDSFSALGEISKNLSKAASFALRSWGIKWGVIQEMLRPRNMVLVGNGAAAWLLPGVSPGYFCWFYDSEFCGWIGKYDFTTLFWLDTFLWMNAGDLDDWRGLLRTGGDRCSCKHTWQHDKLMLMRRTWLICGVEFLVIF